MKILIIYNFYPYFLIKKIIMKNYMFIETINNNRENEILA